MASAVVDKPLFVVREAGTLFSVSLDGIRNIPKIRQWWQEYLRQCWFISKVTSIPVMLISIPFGMVIALHVGSFSRQLGAESATGAAMVLAIVAPFTYFVRALVLIPVFAALVWVARKFRRFLAPDTMIPPNGAA